MRERTTPDGLVDEVAVASARARYLEGVRSMLPFLLSVVPMALVGGALGPTSGLSGPQTLGIAMAANSGTAQFVAFSMIAHGASTLTVALTTLVLGLRMIIYSTILRPHFAQVPRGWKVVVAFGLIDAIFVVAVERLKDGRLTSHRHWFFLGASSVMYGVWMSCTVVGIVLGGLVPDPQEIGLDFPMTAMFVAMLALMVTSWKTVAVVLAAAVTTIGLRGMPYSLGVIFAVAAGIATGPVWYGVLARRVTADVSQEEK